MIRGYKNWRHVSTNSSLLVGWDGYTVYPAVSPGSPLAVSLYLTFGEYKLTWKLQRRSSVSASGLTPVGDTKKSWRSTTRATSYPSRRIWKSENPIERTTVVTEAVILKKILHSIVIRITRFFTQYIRQNMDFLFRTPLSDFPSFAGLTSWDHDTRLLKHFAAATEGSTHLNTILDELWIRTWIQTTIISGTFCI